jgi:RNAse (barnase) inhibitor barstar
VSGLADVLAGKRASGVYPEDSTAVAAELREAAEQAGWRLVGLDTSSVVDKAGFLETASAAFRFPAYFGRNWDAFADCLADVGGEPGVVVLWEGWSPFAEADEESFATALEIVRERTQVQGEGAFVVLMRGGRPWDDAG